MYQGSFGPFWRYLRFQYTARLNGPSPSPLLQFTPTYSGVQVASAHGRGGAARRPSHVLYLTRLQNVIKLGCSRLKPLRLEHLIVRIRALLEVEILLLPQGKGNPLTLQPIRQFRAMELPVPQH